LQIAPIQSIDAVTVFDDDDVGTVINPATYLADLGSVPPRLVLRANGARPAPARVANGIEVRATAGYGDTAGDVPQPLRQAILIALAHWYERRESVVIGSSVVSVPGSVQALVEPYRQVRL